MAALKELLPPAKSSGSTFYDHSSDPWFNQRYGAAIEEERSESIEVNYVPLYNTQERFKHRPSKPQDFGGGGAFPDIHYPQYPLDMGRKKDENSWPKTLPVTVDNHGNLTFDSTVKQNENANKFVYWQRRDLVPKILKDEEEESDEEVQKEIDETTQQTKAALDKIVNVRLSAAQPKNVPTQSSALKFIKIKPSQQSGAFNFGAKGMIIAVAEMTVDPVEPPKFKDKKVPKASGSPPVPVMHSPPRPVTVKDQRNWKIPPCPSNWKNPKGFTIPLDKRLAADGKGLHEVQINDNFAKLSEAFYVAEQKAREAGAMRLKVQKEMMMKERARRDQNLCALAQKARWSERTSAAPSAGVSLGPTDTNMMDVDDSYDCDKDRNLVRETNEEKEEQMQREKIHEERRRKRERERRLEAKDGAMGKKSKITRDMDRDISEKVALGMASTGTGRGGEVMYDQRLFNQEKGMNSGFATDDQYNVYDKGLFTGQLTFSTLYRLKKDTENEMYVGAIEQMEKIRKTDCFKPDKGFVGTNENIGRRDRPVEFDKLEAEEADPFGLDQFLTEVKKGNKAMDKEGSGGTMKASAG